MYETIFTILVLLLIKHWYIDFVDQSMEEVQAKGNYGEWLGLRHSLKHGLITAIIFALFLTNPVDYLLLGFLDFLVHYHVDWAKININRSHNYTTDKPEFWAWLGLDQLIHNLTYLWLVWIII